MRPKLIIITGSPLPPKREKRVGIYCRVSTNSVYRLKSLTTQVSALPRLTTVNPKWLLVDVYIDIASSCEIYLTLMLKLNYVKKKVRCLDMYDWENVTDYFSEEDRHYKNTYMEINEVYDGKIEVSLFSSKERLYEIYFSYGILYGIIYVDAQKADSKREEIKSELAQEYQNNKEPTGEFINSFCEKHKVCMPSDILFDCKLFP